MNCLFLKISISGNLILSSYVHFKLNSTFALSDPVSYYSVSIHPGKINVFYQSIGGGRAIAPSEARPEQFKVNRHNGKVSLIAKRKIKNGLDYMLFLAKPKKLPNSRSGKKQSFKLNFITLDLSSDQVHTDQVIKRELLHQFLVEARKKWNMYMYLWKAEKQKNGRIHFHIITDKFIPWNELRNVWNRIQQKLGYVTRYREDRLNWHRDGFKYAPQYAPRWDREAQYKAYQEGLRTDWDNPNSVDIHGTRHIVNLKAYFSKEISKNPGPAVPSRPEEKCPICGGLMRTVKSNYRCDACFHSKTHVSGMLWGCSVLLTDLPGGRTDVDSKITEELEAITQSGKAYVYNARYYSIYYCDHKLLTELQCKKLLECFEEYVRQKFPIQFPPTLF